MHEEELEGGAALTCQKKQKQKVSAALDKLYT